MMITLDDVSCLLHLPIMGVLWSPQDISEGLAVEWVVDYLEVSQRVAQQQARDCRGSYYSLEWVYDRFIEHRAASKWAYATRAYLLIYLRDASMFSCKQLDGYPTLLQCWIHEYFSTLGKKRRELDTS
ncbi:unnamed protein product [Lathyrus sativus]|nr:unnamed protein product [Lathyrus sativus]